MTIKKPETPQEQHEWKEWQKEQRKQDGDIERNLTDVEYLEGIGDATRAALGYTPEDTLREENNG